MHAPRSALRSVFILVAAASFTATGARADTTNYDSKPATAAQPVQRAGPSLNNEAFRKLRTQCETDASCGKASGDICAAAADLLVGTDLPDEFREVREDQRVKIALRLLERGVDSSNVARGRAFDWYNKIGMFGLNPYTDPYRAQELLDMMIKSGYPGGELRRIRGSTSIISFAASDAEKRANCGSAKTWLGSGKLDADSVKIAQDVLGSVVCQSLEPAKQ